MNDGTHDETMNRESTHRAPGLGILGVIALAVAAGASRAARHSPTPPTSAGSPSASAS